MKKEHYHVLFEILRESEPHLADTLFDKFLETMKAREGYIILTDEGNVIGSVTFSDYVPNTTMTIHCSIKEQYRKKWLTRVMAQEVFNYVFDFLYLERLTGYSIDGKTDEAGEFLKRLGFKHEGTMRHGIKLNDGFFDVKYYGLLKDDCKWIKKSDNKMEVI